MQLFVIGMHRSGTSMVTGIIKSMGIYFGPESLSTGSNYENPRGFYERKDVRKLNDDILFSVNADWDRILSFSVEDVPDSARKSFLENARPIITSMDDHRPWVLKEPRFCLTFPLWKDLVEDPVCIMVYRNPIEVAGSLFKRNGIPHVSGIALWEAYTWWMLHVTQNSRRILVKYSDFLADPVGAVNHLYKQLYSLGAIRMNSPDPSAIVKLVDRGLYRNRGNEEEFRGYLNSFQLELVLALSNSHMPATTGIENLSSGARSALEAYEPIAEMAGLQKKIEIYSNCIRKIKICAEALKGSARWRLGKGILDALLLQRGRKTAFDHMDEIFAKMSQYENKRNRF